MSLELQGSSVLVIKIPHYCRLMKKNLQKTAFSCWKQLKVWHSYN